MGGFSGTLGQTGAVNKRVINVRTDNSMAGILRKV